MTRRRIVITGYGAISPLGVGADTLIERWWRGHSGIADALGRSDEFEPLAFVTKREAKRFDRFTQFAIGAAVEATDRAGWVDGRPPIDPERVGCIVGTGNGGQGTLESGMRAFLDTGALALSALFVPKAMDNAASSVLAQRHGLQGPSYAIASACSSGSDAIADAVRMLRLRETDIMVVGGAEAGIWPLPIAAFRNMEALSETGVSRPFDARRDGFVMGEGAGILVLEAEEVARERGAAVRGEILGFGASNDAYHMVAPHPEGRGATQALTRAMNDAGIEPDDIDYVNAHGTATPQNDRVETLAIKRALGDRAATVPVSSLKSAIGHLLGAAGAVEAIATLLAITRGVAPPTLNYEVPEEGLDLDYVPDPERFLAPRYRDNGDDLNRRVALSSSFGFGGHNSVLVIGTSPEVA